MAFIINNITYRSSSSKALESYYGSKAFVLNELSDPRNDFSKGAREILLMMFNSYREWTDFTEHYLLDKKEVKSDHIETIVSNLKRIALMNWTVFESNPEIFPKEMLHLWNSVSKNTSLYFYRRASKAVGMDHMQAFSYLIGCLLSLLDSTMYILYEIDCLLGSDLLKSGKPITSNRSNSNRLVVLIDEKDIDSITELQVFDPYTRIQQYIHYVESTAPILIKNLSSLDVNLNNNNRELTGNVLLTKQLTPIVSQFNVVEIIGNKR